MNELIFPAADILEMLRRTRGAKRNRVCFEHYKTAYLKDGSTVTQDELDSFHGYEDLDPAKIPPHLMLVKDRGAYLMSSDLDQPRNEKGEFPVVYAAGCNPDADSGWIQTMRRLCGADDFAVPIDDLDGIEAQLVEALGKKHIEKTPVLAIEVTPEKVRYGVYLAPKRKKPKPADAAAAPTSAPVSPEPGSLETGTSEHVLGLDPTSNEPLDRHGRVPCLRPDSYGQGVTSIEPACRFFVRGIETMGGRTTWSCEGHPKGFYIGFTAAYETARKIAAMGFFTVEIGRGPDEFFLRHSESGSTPGDALQVLRWAAASWLKLFPEIDRHADMAGPAPSTAASESGAVNGELGEAADSSSPDAPGTGHPG